MNLNEARRQTPNNIGGMSAAEIQAELKKERENEKKEKERRQREKQKKRAARSSKEYRQYLRDVLTHKQEKFKKQQEQSQERAAERAKREKEKEKGKLLGNVPEPESLSIRDPDSITTAKNLRNTARALKGIAKVGISAYLKHRKAKTQGGNSTEDNSSGNISSPSTSQPSTSGGSSSSSPATSSSNPPSPSSGGPSISQRLRGAPKLPFNRQFRRMRERNRTNKLMRQDEPGYKPSQSAISIFRRGKKLPFNKEYRRMRTDQEINRGYRKIKARNKETGDILSGLNNEQYSCWREEFIYELASLRQKSRKRKDKDDKPVDIMRGRNTGRIKLNPNVMEVHDYLNLNETTNGASIFAKATPPMKRRTTPLSDIHLAKQPGKKSVKQVADDMRKLFLGDRAGYYSNYDLSGHASDDNSVDSNKSIKSESYNVKSIAISNQKKRRGF